MTAAADKAREVMRGDMKENRAQMDLTDESRVLLGRLLGDQLEDRMRVAVAEGITAAMTDANASLFVRAMFAEAQKVAAEKSVQVAGGIFKALFLRAITFAVLGWLVYAVGGWSALAAFLKFRGTVT